jgi:MerR family transcriptional regulator, copper efflux regulator
MASSRPDIVASRALTIGEAAKHSGVSPKMIRHYEAIRLIPQARRTEGDYRVYSHEDLHRLSFIRRARGLGFSIEEIAELLGLWSNKRRASAKVKALALNHIADLDAKISELKSIRNTLADLAHRCHGDDRPECPILNDLGGTQERMKS